MPAATSGGTHKPGVGLGIRARVAVIVAAARRDEPERGRDLADREHGRGIERAVEDLEATEPGLGQLAHDLDPRRRLAEMGQDGQAVGGPDRLDRLDRPEPAARHVARLAPAEQPREGILDAVRVAGLDQGPGDGRPAQRVVGRARHVEHVVVDREVEVAQPGDRPLEAFAPSTALRGEGRLEAGIVGIHPEAEDVELALPQAEVAIDDRVDLDTGDQGQPGRHGVAGHDLAIAGQRVVVGQRQ